MYSYLENATVSLVISGQCVTEMLEDDCMLLIFSPTNQNEFNI